MSKERLFQRILLLISGLFILTLGIALSVKADLGTSPISSAPYVLSLAFPISMGTIFLVVNLVFILLQVVLLRRAFHWIQVLQLPVALIFSVFTDLALYLVSSEVHVSNYLLQWMLCLLSISLVALGIYLQVKAKVIYLAGEGLCLAISKTFNVEFGKVKVGLDSTLVTIAVVSSFLLLGRLEGVREGTIAAAILVGTMVRVYNRKLKIPERILGEERIPEDTKKLQAAEPLRNMVITIAREFGSGGHEIGLQVARELGIPFYDKELIEMSAKEGGLSMEYVKRHEQKLAHRLLFDLYEQNYAYVEGEMPALDKLFMTQSKVIRDLSRKGPCVIVGRCADFILRDQPGCFRVFVHADFTSRVERVISQYGLNPELAQKEIARIDRERANYCRHFTNQEWGKDENYDLKVDTSRYSLEKCVQLILEALKTKDLPV